MFDRLSTELCGVALCFRRRYSMGLLEPPSLDEPTSKRIRAVLLSAESAIAEYLEARLLDFAHVHQALEAGEFVPYYQPIVGLHTGILQGFEALARWERPGKMLLQPDHFIPVAERDGWIGHLTASLLTQAFVCASRSPGEFTLSINISPVQLLDPTLPRQISEAAERNAFPLRRLIVEVTESALLGELENAGRITGELKEMGCRLALDDFGTGFTELLAATAIHQTKKSGEFTIPGIGKLVKAQRAARLGRNPATASRSRSRQRPLSRFV
jgi:predicted signal transduction protein with EAL and GGDEF domain